MKLSKDHGLPGAVETEKAAVFVNLAFRVLLLWLVHAAIGLFDESIAQDRAVLAGQRSGSEERYLSPAFTTSSSES